MNTLRWVSFPFIGIITFIVVLFLGNALINLSGVRVGDYIYGYEVTDWSKLGVNIFLFIVSANAMMSVVERIIPDCNERIKSRAINIFRILMTTVFILITIFFLYLGIQNNTVLDAILTSIPLCAAAIATYVKDFMDKL